MTSLRASTLGSSSSNYSVFSIALKKKVVKDSSEYWYMWSAMFSWINKKYSMAPSAATLL
jgi:hypothetical protein